MNQGSSGSTTVCSQTLRWGVAIVSFVFKLKPCSPNTQMWASKGVSNIASFSMEQAPELAMLSLLPVAKPPPLVTLRGVLPWHFSPCCPSSHWLTQHPHLCLSWGAASSSLTLLSAWPSGQAAKSMSEFKAYFGLKIITLSSGSLIKWLLRVSLSVLIPVFWSV